MIKVVKSLTRASGGTIPVGAIIDYQISMMPAIDITKERGEDKIKDALDRKKKVEIVFTVFSSIDALITGKPPVPMQDIVEFQIEGKPVRGGWMETDDSIVAEKSTYLDFTDAMAKNYLEEKFLGAKSCEAIGYNLSK